jgi:hypothetical protein
MHDMERLSAESVIRSAAKNPEPAQHFPEQLRA